MIVLADGNLRLGFTDTTLNFMSCNHADAKLDCIVSQIIFSIENGNNLHVISSKAKLITI